MLGVEKITLKKKVQDKLLVYSIIPQKGTSTRRIIIGLANGEFNGRLEDVI